MNCPKCGSELRKGLSFCPKCGTVVSDVKRDSKARNVNTRNVQLKKKTTAWSIILTVLFFPITLTYVIVKSKKLQTPLKTVLIGLLWLIPIVMGGLASVSNNQSNTESNTQSNTQINTESNNDSNIEINASTEENNMEQPASEDSAKHEDLITESESRSEDTVVYHKDEGLNQLLIDYNAIAEIPISPEMVDNGVYFFECNITVNEVYIQLYNSSTGLFVDFYDEAASDASIYPLFRDFAKALKSELTDKVIEQAWNELKSNNYDYYTDKYDMGGIKASYDDMKLNNGTFSYSIKLELYK